MKLSYSAPPPQDFFSWTKLFVLPYFRDPLKIGAISFTNVYPVCIAQKSKKSIINRPFVSDRTKVAGLWSSSHKTEILSSAKKKRNSFFGLILFCLLCEASFSSHWTHVWPIFGFLCHTDAKGTQTFRKVLDLSEAKILLIADSHGNS